MNPDRRKRKRKRAPREREAPPPRELMLDDIDARLFDNVRNQPPIIA